MWTNLPDGKPLNDPPLEQRIEALKVQHKQ